MRVQRWPRRIRESQSAEGWLLPSERPGETTQVVALAGPSIPHFSRVALPARRLCHLLQRYEIGYDVALPAMPRVFISYSHDSPEHSNRVWDLSERLRQDGVDCRIDQHEVSPPEGWPRWCRNQVHEAAPHATFWRSPPLTAAFSAT